MSEDALRKIALEVRNWGRWGPDDELGTLNHITPDRIAAACRLVTAGEVRPSEIPGFRNPFHVVAIPNMGLTLGEIFFLEELAADCAADGRYAFLLVAPPLPVTRAVGTPINPYALK
jgi:hypothetical protein